MKIKLWTGYEGNIIELGIGKSLLPTINAYFVLRERDIELEVSKKKGSEYYSLMWYFRGLSLYHSFSKPELLESDFKLILELLKSKRREIK
jgi:hypothetical protein